MNKRKEEKNLEMITIKTISTSEFESLSFLEGQKDIPFEIKRIYYIYGVTKDSKRGGYSHKNLSQLLFAFMVRLEFFWMIEKKEILLDSPFLGIIIKNGIWREMVWEIDNSVLCVAASDYYNESDYISNYNEFLNYKKEGYWNNES